MSICLVLAGTFAPVMAETPCDTLRVGSVAIVDPTTVRAAFLVRLDSEDGSLLPGLVALSPPWVDTKLFEELRRKAADIELQVSSDGLVGSAVFDKLT